MRDDSPTILLGRRAFLRAGTLVLSAAAVGGSELSASDARPGLQIGLLTDLHYADKPPAGTRHYRETLGKLAEAAGQFEQSKPDFVVELGDLIDAADSVETEQRYLKTIDREFAALCEDRHYVLGNHCVDTLTKEEFLGQSSFRSMKRSAVSAPPKPSEVKDDVRFSKVSTSLNGRDAGPLSTSIGECTGSGQWHTERVPLLIENLLLIG